MDTIEHEQLFTDLTSAQAETIAINGGSGYLSVANASYGGASLEIQPTPDRGSFVGNLSIADWDNDGYPVYAKFQGKTADGRILTSSTTYLHLKGDNTSTSDKPVRFSFGKNVDMRKVWVAILRRNPGRDPYVSGNWIYLPG